MRMPTDCLIERAVSDDATRAHLSSGAYLDVKKKRLAATNGHMLAVVPVTPDPGDHDGFITEEALKAGRKARKKYCDMQIGANGALVVQGGPTFPRPEAKEFPPIDQVIPEIRKGDPGTITIGLNAEYLLDLAKAIGAYDKHAAMVSVTIRIPQAKSVDGGFQERLAATEFEDCLEPMVVKGARVDGVGVLIAEKVDETRGDALGVLMPARV